jgi:hypothetical protein
MISAKPSNADVAELLEQTAELLESQGANPFRVRAYREGAAAVEHLERPISEILSDEGRRGLQHLPAIGEGLARAIEEIVHTGRLLRLERLLGRASPEDLFQLIPGIGEDLAERIHESLGIETLEELELAAHDGRLERVPGFGERRVHAVRDQLDSMLRRSGRRRAMAVDLAGKQGLDEPSVSTLLGIDAEYRRRASAHELRRIAPRRFNPRSEAWLPVMHVEKHGFSFTVMYSNTARAHQLGRTKDWVVIYFERNGREGQRTVVTEYRGELAGQRVVRGRESESLHPTELSGRS